MRLILASGSAARRAMLASAGLKTMTMPADIDESGIKTQAAGDAAHAAQQLAHAKAARISALAPGALVIGADQILSCEGQLFDKPAHIAAAGAQLRTLRGRTHELITAVCLIQDGTQIWSHTETPRLTMRNFSDDFLAGYLAAEGSRLCACVGAYRLEGPGIQLFDRVEGDYFTILGLPLLALLAFLRTRDALPA
jgi:septum formation protein